MYNWCQGESRCGKSTATQWTSQLKSVNVVERLDVYADSAGFVSGNFATIQVGDLMIDLCTEVNCPTRGMNMVVLDPNSGKIVLMNTFDTHESSAEFAAALAKLIKGSIVVVSVKDEASKNLSWEVKEFFEKMGSTEIRYLGWRESWAFIGVLGGNKRDVVETRGNARE